MLFPQQMSGFEIQRFCPAVPLQTGISADCFYFYILWLKRSHRREAAFQVPSISLTNDYLFVCSTSVKFSSLSPQIWIPLHFFAARVLSPILIFPLCSVTLSRSPPSWCHHFSVEVESGVLWVPLRLVRLLFFKLETASLLGLLWDSVSVLLILFWLEVCAILWVE